MSTDIEKIYQGDSSKIYKFSSPGAPDLSSVDWTGRVVVKEAKCYGKTQEYAVLPGGVDLLNKVLEKDNLEESFLAFLTPAETGTLTPDKYYIMVVEVTNATLSIPVNSETHIVFKILLQGSV